MYYKNPNQERYSKTLTFLKPGVLVQEMRDLKVLDPKGNVKCKFYVMLNINTVKVKKNKTNISAWTKWWMVTDPCYCC